MGVGADTHQRALLLCDAAGAPVDVEAMRIGVEFHRDTHGTGLLDDRGNVDRVRFTREQQTACRVSEDREMRIVERLEGTAGATDTAIGRVPSASDLDLAGLDIDDATMTTLLSVDNAAWSAEIPQIEAHLDSFGAELPSELRDELRELEKRLG